MFKKFLKSNVWKIVLSMVLITIPTVVVYLQADNLVEVIALEISDNGGSFTFPKDIIESYGFYLYTSNWIMIFIKYLIDKNNIKKCNESVVECKNTSLKQKISSVLLWIVPIIAIVVNVSFYLLYRK